MRYLIISLCLLLFVGCAEPQYDRCLKVEKAKIVENWEDIYEIAGYLVRDFGFPLDFDGVLDREITTQEDIQILRKVLQTMADLPHLEIAEKQVKIIEMIEQGAEESSFREEIEELEAHYSRTDLLWDAYFGRIENLLDSEIGLIYEAIDRVVDSYKNEIPDENRSNLLRAPNYWEVPNDMMIAAQYDVINDIEKSNKEDMKKLDVVRNEIASNICNTRGLYQK